MSRFPLRPLCHEAVPGQGGGAGGDGHRAAGHQAGGADSDAHQGSQQVSQGKHALGPVGARDTNDRDV